MPLIWELLSDKDRNKLEKYQQRHYNSGLNPPFIPSKDITVKGSIESSEELSHLMQEAPSHPRRVA